MKIFAVLSIIIAIVINLFFTNPSLVFAQLDSSLLKGIYVLYPVASPEKNFTAWVGSTLTNSNIEGYAMKFAWDDIQPTSTTYNWDFMINNIKTAAVNNKKIFLWVQTVWHAPEWLYNSSYNVTKILYKDGVLQPDGSRILQDAQFPLPWNAVYLSEVKNLITALKNRLMQRGGVNDLTDAEYNSIIKINIANPGGVRDTFDLPTGKDDPSQIGVIDTRVPEPNYIHDYDYEWLNGKYVDTNKDGIQYVITADVYANEKLFNASKEIADHTAFVFPEKFIGRTVFMRWNSLARTALENFIVYLTRDSVYKDRIVLQINSLAANWLKKSPDEKRYEYLESSRLKYGTLIGFEMVWSSENPVFNKDGLLYPLRQALINGIDRGGDWMQIYVKDAKDSALEGDIIYARNLLKNFSSDETNPTDISIISAGPGVNSGELKINFLAPGDDYDAKTSQPAGEVSGYIVKYSKNPIITSSDFNSAITYFQNWIPARAGRQEGDGTQIGPVSSPYIYSKVLAGLAPGQSYYVAIKAKDDMGKISAGFVAISGAANDIFNDVTSPSAPIGLTIQ